MTATSPVFILQELIHYPSITPQVGPCFDFLQAFLKPLGFEIERPFFSADNTPTIENLFAAQTPAQSHSKTENTDKPKQVKRLLFAGHCDVVPEGDTEAWRFPPFSGEIEDGQLFGRGAVDMKGGIACFLAALARLAKEDKLASKNIALAITGDEEGPAINGTVKLMDWAAKRGERFDAAIIGEPSSVHHLGDMIKIGRRGSLSACLIVEGKQGHVAYPHNADNPLPVLLELVQALIATPLDQGNAHFQPSNLELTTIDTGNKASNVIPATSKAQFNIRFNDIWQIDSLKQELHKRLEQAFANCQTNGEISYHLEFVANPSTAFITHNQDLIAGLSTAVETITGQPPKLSTGGGTSDARFIKNYCPVAEIGLVGQTMHQVDERVAIEDLEKLTQIYYHFIEDFFA